MIFFRGLFLRMKSFNLFFFAPIKKCIPYINIRQILIKLYYLPYPNFYFTLFLNILCINHGQSTP